MDGADFSELTFPVDLPVLAEAAGALAAGVDAVAVGAGVAFGAVAVVAGAFAGALVAVSVCFGCAAAFGASAFATGCGFTSRFGSITACLRS